jgi:hypothetical protein
LLSPLSLSPVSIVATQQWWHSNGHSDGREGGGAAMAIAAQQWQWWRSSGNGNGSTAMGVAVVVAAQQWQRSNGGGSTAMMVDRSHCRVP